MKNVRQDCFIFLFFPFSFLWFYFHSVNFYLYCVCSETFLKYLSDYFTTGTSDCLIPDWIFIYQSFIIHTEKFKPKTNFSVSFVLLYFTASPSLFLTLQVNLDILNSVTEWAPDMLQIALKQLSIYRSTIFVS